MSFSVDKSHSLRKIVRICFYFDRYMAVVSTETGSESSAKASIAFNITPPPVPNGLNISATTLKSVTFVWNSVLNAQVKFKTK